MKYPWMPLFNGDLLANTLHLSAQEFGAYMLLIIHAWEHAATVKVRGAHRIARVDNRHWPAVRDTLAPFFDPPDGLQGMAVEVIHRRVALELAKAGELANKRKEAALQMHSKRRAGAPVYLMPLPSPSLESSSNSERKEAQASVQVQTNYRDKGPSYRAPPAKKVDNVLEPLPEKPVRARPQKQTGV